VLNVRSVAIMTVVAALTALPVVAQQAGQSDAPPASAAPAPTPAPAPAQPGGLVATTNNPNLSVASVRLENGVRASKVVGSTVYNEQNERVGSVDDLIMTEDDKVTVAIISVGGFLGLGSKLVAVPFGQLKRDADRVVLTGATKDTLNGMPSFVY